MNKVEARAKYEAEVETSAVKYGEAQAELERAEVKRDEALAKYKAICNNELIKEGR